MLSSPPFLVMHTLTSYVPAPVRPFDRSDDRIPIKPERWAQRAPVAPPCRILPQRERSSAVSQVITEIANDVPLPCVPDDGRKKAVPRRESFSATTSRKYRLIWAGVKPDRRMLPIAMGLNGYLHSRYTARTGDGIMWKRIIRPIANSEEYRKP